MAYSLAGADCIDVAADPAVVAAAREALQVSSGFADEARQRGYLRDEGTIASRLPLLMVSLNDGEDPHFRKAEFDPVICPPDCPRPCEKICPAQAIAFSDRSSRINPKAVNSNGSIASGVIEERCYGCGRCLPVCPIGQIVTRSYVSTPTAIAPTVLSKGVDAVEIHTQVGRLDDFKRLWNAIAPWVDRLQVVAISCPNGKGAIAYLQAISEAISPLPCVQIWQTDGRPMSGDIGKGTTHAAIEFGQKVLAAGLPGYVQLAGGTNHYTVAKLKAMGLLQSHLALDGKAIASEAIGSEEDAMNRVSTGGSATGETSKRFIAGIAYGSYARVLLSPILERLEQRTQAALPQSDALENHPDLLWEAVNLAHSLVSQLKVEVELQRTTNNTKQMKKLLFPDPNV